MKEFAEKYFFPVGLATATSLATVWVVFLWGPGEAPPPAPDAPKIVVTQRAVEIPVLAADLAQDELLDWLRPNQSKKKPLAQILPPEGSAKEFGSKSTPSLNRSGGGEDGEFLSPLDWMMKRRPEPKSGYVISQIEIKNVGTAIYRDITVSLADWIFVTARYRGNFSTVMDRPAKFELNPDESVVITGLIDGTIEADGSIYMASGKTVVASEDTPVAIDLLRPETPQANPPFVNFNTKDMPWWRYLWLGYLLLAIAVGSFYIGIKIGGLLLKFRTGSVNKPQ